MDVSEVLEKAGDISFSNSALAGFGIEAAVFFLLPLAAIFFMKKFSRARVYSMLVGVIVYFLAICITSLLAGLLGFAVSAAQRTVIAAEIICLFEEPGRWLAMKYPLTDIKTTYAAVCYGIGHGGLECFNRGIQRFSYILDGQTVNHKGIAAVVDTDSASRASDIVKQYQYLAENTVLLSLLASVESIVIFCVHIALSLLIYKRLYEDHSIKRGLLPAIGLHYLINAASYLASLSENGFLTRLAGIGAGLAVIAVVFRLIGFKQCVRELKDLS
ncbi:MAG: YhfC family intramembrane metalloprotease [Ruminococcus sp.]|nr:YhfC family intramembrane metalloprotease [Ruminococcus sp.]